jgi:carbon-monoxide dehydrogenase large subunit
LPSDSREAFLKGLGKYVADYREENVLYLSFLRSPYAHARIKKIEAPLLVARGVPFFRGADVNKEVKPIPIIWEAAGMKMATQYVLAQDKARYFGEPLAAVASPNSYDSEDLIELINAHLEPLDAVSTVEEALKEGCPLLHDQFQDKTNIGLSIRRKHGNPDKAFANPDILIKERFNIGRVTATPIEPRGVLSSYNRTTGLLTIISSTQIPFMLKRVLSITLGIPENRVRVITPDIGGGFGGKDGVSPEEILASYAALKSGHPIMWIESRSENVAAAVHDREQVQYVEAAASRDGVINGLKVSIITNAGAYYRYKGARMVFLTAYMICGQYRIQNLEVESTSVLTNTLPTFPYRGPGSTQAIFLIERIMDRVAQKTGIDPAEVRLRNMILPDSFPYETATGATYDSGNYQKCFKLALELSKYRAFEAEKERARRNGRFIGIGIGLYVDQAGLGPTKLMSSLGIKQGGWERSVVSVDQSGRVTVYSGVTPIGQGIERGIARVVAEELGVRESEVIVKCGDTTFVSYGGGALASRSLSIAGAASLIAARKLKEKILRIASHMIEARHTDLLLKDGHIAVRGISKPFLTLADVAKNSYLLENVPTGEEPGLEETAVFDPENFTFPYGAMVAKVEVDINTGQVKLLSFDAVHDCGKIISLEDVQGQMLGGIAQGIGEALTEEVIYDSQGQLLTGNLIDYLIPTVLETPSRIGLDHIETPSPINPLGAKGVGESGIIGSPVAIANAVENALSPFGVTISELPLKPSYVWQLIQKSSARQQA